MAKTITTNTQTLIAPEGGTNSSSELENFSKNVAEDLSTIASFSSDVNKAVERVSTNTVDEMNHLRTSIKALETKQDAKDQAEVVFTHSVDFFSKDKVSYAEGTKNINKLVADQRHGQVYLPPTNVVPLFYTEDTASGDITPNNDLTYLVTPISEPASTDSQTRSLSEGNVLNAFNGFNADVWNRTIRYPLESTVDEISASIEINVPEDGPSTGVCNVFTLNPYPLGKVDVLGIYYKATANAEWALLPTFPSQFIGGILVADPILNADHINLIMNKISVVQFRVDLRQRNWKDENNKKIFTYGAQEISARYVDFSTASSDWTTLGTALEERNHVMYEIESPANTTLTEISTINIDPSLEEPQGTPSKHHCLYILSKEPNLDPNNILYQSHVDPLPQAGTAIEVSLSKYYLIIIQRFVSEILIEKSPHKVKTTPVSHGVNIIHGVKPISTSATPAVPSVDWEHRNGARHFDNLMQMDIHLGAASDGSNMMIFWDDFWNDTSWRTELTQDSTGLVFDEEKMACIPTSDLANNESTLVYKEIPHTGLFGTGNQDWFPEKVRLASSSSLPINSSIEYTLKYTMGTAGLQTLVINPSEWTQIGIAGDNITKMYLEIKFTNSPSGGTASKPILYHLAMIIKD
jgi:hypothetical protein